ncbi:ABC transporter substrate-binding protein [Cognatishimia sp. 1_MG-2023]|uniref:ABC transporter substrate-binding protein n=1 Tax=Cognatishimia sp. 1_MG-2023 TaxID=3062642 RepID=UPI0026E2FB34|nr:ABC transporter substrate-binding protein [Cognatishimia sp. 1_MG-2023]MDO6728223.1 ABC transporter substrate-binding protein [Cognatishimia sp. 1_MG-2023]
MKLFQKNNRAAAALATVAMIGTPALAQDNDLKIGFAVSLTGYLAPYDTPTVEGAQIAIKELNENGGAAGQFAIEAMVRDVRSDTVQTSIVVQELIDAGADVIVLPCDDDPAIAGGLVAQDAGIPMFSTCATNASLTAAIGDFYFVNYVADIVQGATLAQFAREEGLSNAYLLVSPETTYTGNLPLYFGEVFETLGGSVVDTGTYSFGQQDFSAEVTQIASLNPQPDVIMTSAYEPDFPAFLRQLRAAGVTAAVYGSDGIDSPTTSGLGDVSEGVVFTNAGFPVEGTRLAAFFDAYAAHYDRPLSNSFAATGYDMMLVISEAIRVAGGTDGAALRDAIANTDGLEVSTGEISYLDRNRVPARSVSLNRITGGAITHVDTRVIASDLLPESK